MISFKGPSIRPCVARFAAFAGILVAGWFFCMHRTVHARLLLDAPVSGGVQVYYRTDPDEGFSEARRISVRPDGSPAVADVSLPARRLCGLRFDFGSAPGDFTVLGGTVGDMPLPPWKKWSFSPDVASKDVAEESGGLRLFSDGIDPFMFVSFRRPVRSEWTVRRERIRFLLMAAVALAAAFATGRILALRIGNGRAVGEALGGWGRPVVAGLSPFECLFLLACAAYYGSWVAQPFNFSPDEAMRYGVTRFLFNHGRLPVNEETISDPWGFSYAHIPTMFCNVFGALFMKIGSWFSSDATTLLRAARMVGVVCVTGTVYWTLRASRLLFRAPFHWLPVCIVAFLPQFAYIGSYVNNDSAALFGTSMILFAWASAVERRWSYGTATILAVGIAVCATSYYNSYSWILFSMLMFPLTYVVRNGRQGLVRMGLFVSAVVLVLGSYLFLRHLRLYGDLLGFETCRRFAMQYASPDFVPGVRKSLYASGCSLPYMLLGMQWIWGTAYSFIGYFGWLQYPIPSWCYVAYALVFVGGGLGVLWKGADWIRGWRKVGVCRWAFLVSLVGCAAITVGLSVYYSYTRDYQAQGRYCFPALLPVALLSAKGVERIADGLVARKGRGVLVLALCLLLWLVTGSSYLVFRNLY